MNVFTFIVLFKTKTSNIVTEIVSWFNAASVQCTFSWIFRCSLCSVWNHEKLIVTFTFPAAKEGEPVNNKALELNGAFSTASVLWVLGLHSLPTPSLSFENGSHSRVCEEDENRTRQVSLSALVYRDLNSDLFYRGYTVRDTTDQQKQTQTYASSMCTSGDIFFLPIISTFPPTTMKVWEKSEWAAFLCTLSWNSCFVRR